MPLFPVGAADEDDDDDDSNECVFAPREFETLYTFEVACKDCELEITQDVSSKADDAKRFCVADVPLEHKNGAQVWDAAILLSEHVMRDYEPGFWVGKTVLELGAGTGLGTCALLPRRPPVLTGTAPPPIPPSSYLCTVGLTLAKLGAKVTLTDLTYTVPLIQHNVDANFRAEDEAPIPVAAELDWNLVGSAHEADISIRPPFDFVVGSDILYWKQSWPLFVPLLCWAKCGNILILESVTYPSLMAEFCSLVSTDFDATTTPGGELKHCVSDHEIRDLGGCTLLQLEPKSRNQSRPSDK
jgi:predicted nicotinamide N-methyase